MTYGPVLVKCPACGISLMDEHIRLDNAPAVKLNFSHGERKGEVWLSSIYGSYVSRSSFDLIPGDVVILSCPLCQADLPASATCSDCDAKLVDLHLLEGGRVSICSRYGCKNHAIEFENTETAMHHFFKET